MKRNPTLRDKRSRLGNRLLRSRFGAPSALIYLAIYLTLACLLLAAQYLAVEHHSEGLITWKPTIASRPLKEVMAESFVLALTAIAGVLTLVAMAVGLLGNMLSNSSEETFDAFFHEANPKGVVRCGVALLTALLAEYFWPLHGLLELVQDDTGILVTRVAQIVVLLL